jgi:hypothetical protein
MADRCPGTQSTAAAIVRVLSPSQLAAAPPRSKRSAFFRGARTYGIRPVCAGNSPGYAFQFRPF